MQKGKEIKRPLIGISMFNVTDTFGLYQNGIMIDKKIESGVVVIKHWKIHNYIAKDRFVETKYKEEREQLQLDENKAYTTCIQPVYEMETQVRLGKDRLGKDSIEGEQKRKRFVPPTLEEVKDYCSERKNNVDAERFFDYYSANGWVQGKNKPIKDWKACVRTWEKNDKGSPAVKPQKDDPYSFFV